MAVLNRITKRDAESGLSYRLNKDFNFLLTRVPLPEGADVYVLENKSKNERLIIPRELYDRFRAAFLFFQQEFESSQAPQDVEKSIYFRDKEVYKFRPTIGDTRKIIIQDGIKMQGSSGFITIPMEAFAGLAKIFYQPSLKHTSEVFERLVRYHKLFQFSFTSGSESITSQLSLRRDVLSQIDEYVPMMRSNGGDKRPQLNSDTDGVLDLAKASGVGVDKKNQAGKFKPKLGQKDGEKSYTVDYATLFQSGPATEPERLLRTADDQTKRGGKATAKTFPLPLNGSDIKSLTKIPFPCELTTEDATFLRESFLQDRSAELYLGFEMIDAIFKTEGKMKTFRFPLYYMKVTVEESGRLIHIHPTRRPEIYLNHLALTSLVESFSPENPNGMDPLEQFFQTLTSQKIEIRGRMLEISIYRQLPVLEDVFQRTRDILLGLPGENGKGGILGGLKLIGIECDLESVALYKSSLPASPVAQALEIDIDRILTVADEYPERFYRSLLGRFLTPELKNVAHESKPFYQSIYCPGALPQSTLELFNKLNHNDIVLLEGPPGTGKTFAIMNLLIHCINTGQRLLVVSDQKAAIHALDEKLQEFLLGNDRESPLARSQLTLFRQAVKVVDRVPEGPLALNQWMAALIECLALDNSRDLHVDKEEVTIQNEIAEIDAAMHAVLAEVQQRMQEQLAPDTHRRLVAPKHAHPTTAEDIKDFIAFLEFAGAGRHEKKSPTQKYTINAQILRDFIMDRAKLSGEPFLRCYEFFAFDGRALDQDVQRNQDALKMLSDLWQQKPRDESELESILSQHEDSIISRVVWEQWRQAFPGQEWALKGFLRKLWSFIQHPCRSFWMDLGHMLEHQRALLEALIKAPDSERVCRQMQSMHETLHPLKAAAPSLALEAGIFSQLVLEEQQSAVQALLQNLRELQDTRDRSVKELFLLRMSHIVEAGRAKDAKNPTSAWTSIETLLQGLKECSSIEHGVGVVLLQDLQRALVQAFPVWVCRKQAVSFLFPAKEQLFDLVIIDEAGQCRVDDAVPLLYRARKIMVVGDDKQTVLDKNSPVDDFLFQAFNLEDHLRQTQARGMKGGGSHIFGLVKSIKQAEVMLDEHFRCPPQIIHYSNKYVYDSQLKIMQWARRDMPPAVVVDYREKDETAHNKPTSGKFKDIETDLIDRFFEYIAGTIKKIEKELGRQINIETEVAICYFLLKNEPYIKEKKPQFLAKMNRGKDVLDGAGAALQGKERNFIFYLWDINRGNMRAFRMGDEPDKRRGELNVLMSRPKMRAYHYLHASFDTLKHETATIADYLWNLHQNQKSRQAIDAYEPRTKRPGAEFLPWKRSSGELMRAVLSQVLSKKYKDKFQTLLDEAQVSVVVGNPKRKVDLMLLGSKPWHPSIAIVDLATFETDRHTTLAIADYFFQLKRATPPLEPIFVFLHELADERSQSFMLLVRKMEELLARD
ncbi:MAG TPA: hypothetical protein VE954_15035 [Oligoflexus sp.]|uniref:hypothetical protein n=1 Tax=Oligoflexus sp. TaxID=1971216 RepID=UPI002D721701|nr:hypothetical protein [Oligoflexus sp.]HYX34417.1 hypothetical protein [Oligoflexus sp.]